MYVQVRLDFKILKNANNYKLLTTALKAFIQAADLLVAYIPKRSTS